MARAPSVAWSREHRLIALNLYFKLPFGQLHRNNPIIKEVAQKMGRTASSLAIKLCNFASLDPVLKARGLVGMRGAASQDRVIWREFRSQLSTLAPESEEMLHDLFTTDENREVDLVERSRVTLTPSRVPPPSRATERNASVRVRR